MGYDILRHTLFPTRFVANDGRGAYEFCVGCGRYNRRR